MLEQKPAQATHLDALATKGAAFTHAERRTMGLLGPLATAEKTLAQQAVH
jgi:malate dehydrogenase (oxaloacetate-decarboxylating)